MTIGGCPHLPSIREAVNRLFHLGLEELNKQKRRTSRDFAAESDSQHEEQHV